MDLAAMTGFILFLAIWVENFTTASRKTVFGAVTTYATVLVVFVGGSDGLEAVTVLLLEEIIGITFHTHRKAYYTKESKRHLPC
jgi:hypothetical protein